MNPPFSIAIAKACLDASALSYDKATVQSSVAHVLIQETEINGEWYLVIAARGTKNIKDWLTDGRIVLVPDASTPGARVHNGFEMAFSSVIERVKQIALDSKANILCTGHSLGGALAMRLAKALHADFRLCVSGVYTFGQPRVGNGAFADAYNIFLQRRTFRFVNEEDLVPRVPGLLIGYRHAGQEIFFPSDRAGFEVDPSVALKLLSDFAGAARDFLNRRISCVTDHFVTEYQHRFNKEFLQANPTEVAA